MLINLNTHIINSIWNKWLHNENMYNKADVVFNDNTPNLNPIDLKY